MRVALPCRPQPETEPAVGLVFEVTGLMGAECPGAPGAPRRLEFTALHQYRAEAQLAPRFSGLIRQRLSCGQRPSQLGFRNLVQAQPVQQRKGLVYPQD